MNPDELVTSFRERTSDNLAAGAGTVALIATLVAAIVITMAVLLIRGSRRRIG